MRGFLATWAIFTIGAITGFAICYYHYLSDAEIVCLEDREIGVHCFQIRDLGTPPEWYEPSQEDYTY